MIVRARVVPAIKSARVLEFCFDITFLVLLNVTGRNVVLFALKIDTATKER